MSHEKRSPEVMAEAIIFATEETNRLLGMAKGTGVILDDAAVVAQVMLDLLAACKGAKKFIESLKVPQTLADAAEQVRQGMHRLRSLEDAIKKAEQT
jgi:TRAP-type C4-dicarboxylate transport system permease large subunit